ncbi:MAG: 50S ribosomal protein L11 methyltransferase [Desulforhopalus sp.]
MQDKINNKWLKITIKTDPLLVEPISDFLEGVIEAGVETGARDELLYGTVNGYLQKSNLDQTEIDRILSQVSSYLAELAVIFGVSEPILSSTMIEEEDWGKNWKEHFKPFAIVPGLVIAPTWEEYQPTAGEAVITMDPGMAFGTGHHATTSLSLNFLRETLADSDGSLRVLDVGTGTGILGMAAVLFGAGEVLGIDNDPEAVSAAEENVHRNSLQDRMQISLAPLDSLEEPYEIVVANIVHDVLIGMADDLTRLTADGGTLILSGILAGDQVENITNVFKAKEFRLSGQGNRDEWSALCFGKRE